jgi:hypothetical protein
MTENKKNALNQTNLKIAEDNLNITTAGRASKAVAYINWQKNCFKRKELLHRFVG